jgi:hypothetical protein
MNTTLYKMVLVAGGLAMATAVIAQTQMRTAPSPGAVGQVQMAAPTAVDFAQMKARLNADEALITSLKAKVDGLESKTTGMVGGINQLQKRFETHTHPLLSDSARPGDKFVATLSCNSGTGDSKGMAVCKNIPLPEKQDAYLVGARVIGIPQATGTPTN